MTIEIAYGFVGMQSLFNKRVQEVGVRRVFDAITQSAAYHTDMINTLMIELMNMVIIQGIKDMLALFACTYNAQGA